jgi:hypothetical protein
MKPELRDQIVKHAFETEEKLRISIMVGVAFPAIIEKLIRDDLGGTIIGAMGNTWLCSVVMSGMRFTLSLRSRSWPEGLWVGLQDREEGATHLFAVWRPDNPQQRAVLDERLHRALCQALPETRPQPAGGAYPWWGFLDRYRSWSPEEFLLALAGKGVRKDLEDWLLRLCKAAAEAIDQDAIASS